MKVEKIKTKVKNKGDPAKRAAAAAARKGLVAQPDGSVDANSEKAAEEANLGTEAVDGVAEKLEDAKVE